MSLKSIKSNYTKLLQAFSDAGVKINESQKEVLDNFVSAIQNKLTETRDSAIRATKKIVEEKLEKEYKEVVESILKENQKVNELAGQIQNKVSEINESKKIADKVDSYLDYYLGEVLPKKTIVDYSRMEKLEKIHESLKDLFIVTDPDIENKIASIKEEMIKESKGLKDEIESLKKQINESKKSEETLKKQLNESQAKEMISEKTKDLPKVEADELKKKFEGKNTKEIEESFETELKAVQEKITDEQNEMEGEKNLEEAIKDIVNDASASSDTTNSNKEAEGLDVDPTATADESDSVTEEYEETVISESVMQSWIDTLNRITPKK